MKKKSLVLSIALFILSLATFAQSDLKKPEASQAAVVSQRIGLTDISINYHSPLAKGRAIWGALVPYNEVWRAGANENTTIQFSSEVKVEGKVLPAGTYGLHMIPSEKAWTIIFSKNYYAWGSFFYKETEDALRVTVQPQTAPQQDWLSYSFMHPEANKVNVELHWEKLIVPFQIEVNVPEIVVESMSKELSNINGFFWQGYNQAANYCIQNNLHLDKAAAWLDKSISIQKNFTNLNTKAKLLEKQGKAADATAMRKEALSIADEVQLNAYGYELMAQNNTKEAVEIFTQNVKRNPGSWNVYDSLGEALANEGNNKEAIINYKKAAAKAPEGQQKRIAEMLKKLEAK